MICASATGRTGYARILDIDEVDATDLELLIGTDPDLCSRDVADAIGAELPPARRRRRSEERRGGVHLRCLTQGSRLSPGHAF